MGWGEANQAASHHEQRLVEAVRRWRSERTTRAEERLSQALDEYDTAAARAASTETGRRSGW